MDFRRDDRGQAIQVGAVLLFAMLIIAMSIYQAQVVPRENAKIEFDSYLDASSDMTQLRNDMLGVAATNNQRGTTVTTGTTYPARIFFVNPPTATGRIRTGAPENLSFANVRSTSDEGNVDRYFQSEDSTLEYSTRDVRFVPQYSEIDVAPVVVANGFTYRNYSTPIPLTTQTVIQGNRLTFVTVEGDLDAGGVTTPITTDPVSAHTRTVTVTNRTSSPLNVTIPTPIPASTWEDEILAGQLSQSSVDDRHVLGVAPGPRPNTINVTLEPGTNYELRLGRIELHERAELNETESPPARYLVAETETTTQTNRNGRIALTVEARDRFNNPVSNADVTFNQSSGSGRFETEDGNPVTFPVRTDEAGQATVYYNATGHLGTIPVDAWLTDKPAPRSDEHDVRFSVFNSVTSGTGGGGSGEQAGRSLVVLAGYEPVQSGDSTLTISVNNTGSFPVNVTGYRLDYATSVKSNGDFVDAADDIVSIELQGETRSGIATEGQSPYFFANNPIVLNSGERDMVISFNEPIGDQKSVMLSFGIYLEGELTVTFTFHILI